MALFAGKDAPHDPARTRKNLPNTEQNTEQAPHVAACDAARAAAFDAFAKLALAYFENPSMELQAACEAAAFVVRTMQKVG